MIYFEVEVVLDSFAETQFLPKWRNFADIWQILACLNMCDEKAFNTFSWLLSTASHPQASERFWLFLTV